MWMIPVLVVLSVAVHAVRIPHKMQLEKAYMDKEAERTDFTANALAGRAVMQRYNQVDSAAAAFEELHSAEMWARFQSLLHGEQRNSLEIRTRKCTHRVNTSFFA